MTDTIFIGLDPSFRGFGISDGDEHIVVGTEAGTHIDDRIGTILEALSEFIFKRVPPAYADAKLPAIWLCIEAPLLRVVTNDTSGLGKSGADGSHLYELGNLMRAIRVDLVDELRGAGYTVVYLEVGIGTLRHFTVGIGGVAKENVPYMVEKIYGKVFERDRGMDKLIAWSLVQYGRAVAAGEETHIFAAPRGSGRHARANVRKAARTRAGRTA